jgi:hypothetical protein
MEARLRPRRYGGCHARGDHQERGRVQGCQASLKTLLRISGSTDGDDSPLVTSLCSIREDEGFWAELRSTTTKPSIFVRT